MPPVFAAVPTCPTFLHRGFRIALAAATADGPFGFSVAHEGERLHTSAYGYGTAVAAERAARRFVDDALESFEHATMALAAS